MPKTALILLHPGFEEIEAIVPIDLLSRAQVQVTQASLTEDLLVTGRSKITLQATHSLADVINDSFDTLIVPGGPGIFQLRNDPTLCALLQKHYSAKKLTACICAAPLLLLDAGLLKDVRYTAHPSTSEELPESQQSPLCQDQHLLTSQGAGTATEFALALVKNLCGDATARAIADSICWPHEIPQ